ncbi:hypothetical protein GQ55_5G339400 [Panicum hallii var. hallii]|uniref:Reverse transcriptase zinc-binding domain-containing protein n=1 Tax=Panicum hallii var. hallii TaxID=1504633 RepID=A0A2T7DM02_9POAL|nr:hypothetical protein GQ55_5G339400 [Panicum hallii var. hallii]
MRSLRPKEFGGLGFLDTRAMNTGLLAKWVSRIDSREDSPCIKLLGKKRYLRGPSFFQSFHRGGSQFWRGLQEVKSWYERGRVCKANSGETVRFWEDVWLGDCTLKTSFPRLYQICRERQCSVADVWGRGWLPDFRRNLGSEELVEWTELTAQLEQVESDGNCRSLAVSR